MSVTIELPEQIERQLAAEWGSVERRALEALAVEGYRSEALSAEQVRQMLGLETRMEVDALLKERGVRLEYTLDDLERERAAFDELSRGERAA